MKIIRLVLLLAVTVGIRGLLPAAEAADIQAILISASNARGETDRRLAPYESTLRRVLRFESFQFLGDASASIAAPGERTLTVGHGHEIEVEATRADERAIQVKVRWSASGRPLMNTGLMLRPGVPAVLGGPSGGRPGEVYAVILIGR